MVRRRNRSSPTQAQRELVGELIGQHRTAAKISLKRLAHDARLTSAYLSYVERGKRGFTDDTLLSISAALQLRRSDEVALLRAAGSVDGAAAFEDDQSPDWGSKLQALLQRANALATPTQRALLLSEIERVVNRHTSKTAEVTKALIPIAGWHVHLLSPAAIRRMIESIIEEGEAAGISRFGIVMPQSFSSAFVKDLAGAHGKSTFHPIVQDLSRLGIGPAIQAGQDFIDDEAFVLALPDIQFRRDERAAILAGLKSRYAKRARSILATRKTTGLRFIRKGAVITANVADDDDAQLLTIERIHYGHVGHNQYYALGRYILTSSVFDVIRSVPPDDDGFVRLGAVLERLLERETIYAVNFSQKNFYSVTLSQELMNEIIDNLTGNFNETQIIAALDALGVQVAPWGRDAVALQQLLDLLEPLHDKTGLEILAKMSAQLSELARCLQGQGSPFIFWILCFRGINEAVSVCAAPAASKTLRKKMADESRNRIRRILDFAEQGHKNQVSEELSQWWGSLEDIVRRLK